MKYATYNYSIRVDFLRPVHSHFFLLRCTPSHNAAQHVVREKCRVDGARLTRGKDSFGNLVHSGAWVTAHDSFEVQTSGEVQLMNEYRLPDAAPNRLYLYPSAYTQPDKKMTQLLKTAAIEKADAPTVVVEKLCALVRREMNYAANSTTNATTAAAALAEGRGVCQDFAHLLIAWARLAGVPARYAVGFIEGEGNTHAWVEFYDANGWRGVDPTHNRFIDTGYIKLAHGRDYEDCSIERGVFAGAAEQKLTVNLSVGMRDYFLGWGNGN
ncbi:transglutaminase [Planctomycetales bacterium]|nr:transglutaminase [Planctomycetales bacterium]GHS99165.1 transglutaminase [Planctomycetales bacterium]GHT05538.1 transglutaminase [Planctomycetales bacterium]